MPLAVFTTLDDEPAARALARAAVERNLAACVHIERIDSVYAWQGEVHEDPEIRLLFKTSAAAYDRLAAFVLEEHPYDTPALWAYDMARGHGPFLDWIDESTG